MTDLSGARGSVLIVDDEAPIRQMLGTAFRSAGYTVRTAADAESALLAIAEGLPDVVVLDLGLPRMSGEEFLRQIRSDGVAVSVVVVSASLDGAAVAAAAGADAYFAKPFDLWVLLRRVAELTGGDLSVGPGC